MTMAFQTAIRAARVRATPIFLAGALAACAPWAHAQNAPPAATSATASAPRLPIEAFARLPLLSQVVLSPDGLRVAALLNQPERTVLITREAVGGRERVALQTDNKEFLFNWVRWVSDDRLLVSLRFASQRGFTATVETRLVSIKPDGSDAVNLVVDRPGAGYVRGGPRPAQLQDQVIDWMPEDGHHVLLQLADRGPNAPAVYEVDVDTGKRRQLQAPEDSVRRWISDAQHRVRVAVKASGSETEVRARDPDSNRWRTLWRYREPADAVVPLGFGLDPQELYVRAERDGRAALFTVRLDQPDLPRTLRLANPQFDVGGGLMRSALSGEIVGLRGGGNDDGSGERRSELWSPAWRALAQSIDAALPRRDNRLIGMSRDEQRYLVYSSGNGVPGGYFVGDRQSGKLNALGETYPTLSATRLAGKRLATIKARDGLALNAFLTRPVGSTAGGGPLPMVLLPHGGPQSRDNLDFDPWAELLANRGYVVLQVNFRGSAGQGSAFAGAGLQRWGLEMQDDLTDAVQWAVAQGIADPARVCIVGASYGGYAALMGLVKTPALYRCGVSFAGVSDLPDLAAHTREYVGGDDAANRIFGDAWRGGERLRATSPARLADKVQVPVLLVHGSDDRVVPVDQSREMAKALRRAGKTVRYIEQEGGDHGLSRNPQRLEFFDAMASFLDEQLRPTAAN